MSNDHAGDPQGSSWEHYWSIDIPSLTEAQAEELTSMVQERFNVTAIVLDPKIWLTMHVDRVTAEAMRDSLRAESNDISTGLCETVEDWLDLIEAPE